MRCSHVQVEQLAALATYFTVAVQEVAERDGDHGATHRDEDREQQQHDDDGDGPRHAASLPRQPHGVLDGTSHYWGL